MIVQKEIDEPKVRDLINEQLGSIEATTAQLTIQVNSHETRIDALEAENPEALRGLTDTNFGTLDITKDQRVVSYDFTTDKFILKLDSSGIGDAPNDGSNYVRRNGLWILLSSTLELNDIGLTLQDHETRIDTLETNPPPSMWTLPDTNFGTLDNSKNGYVVKYDAPSDDFMLLPDNSGLPDAPIDGNLYGWKDEAWEQIPQIPAVLNDLGDV